jgi:copper(I)-binding protein
MRIETTLQRTFGVVVILFACAILGSCRKGSTESVPGVSITISDAHTRPLTKGEPVGVAYLSIHNSGGAPDRLLSGTSPTVEAIELHESITEDGVVKMVARPNGFAIKPNSSFVMKPGGAHLMLFDIKEEVPASGSLELTLEFEHAGAINVDVRAEEF